MRACVDVGPPALLCDMQVHVLQPTVPLVLCVPAGEMVL